ncbi:Integral membrane protein [Candidatus Rhodobacter oscarellae]|uniref:Integral membrane protein n=1 Tax=Candidatus Rhodobacter oscarellae TaxID=1675527 RepID=A0A0J9E8S2_9RHOB|nr:DMT family transporter [Candidatus Rhodobacter lobularis]KMW59056.1 Integral membrane protein [Candidatus Rhodobacter lobularis]
MLPSTQSALIMLCAGVAVPVLAALNAGLGVRIGSPVSAAVVLFVVALASALLAYAVLGGSFAGLAQAPKGLMLGGCLVAFYVLSITWIAPTFGVGNAVFFVLLGQLISAAIIDHFGLFGAQVTPLSLTRAAGIAAMGGGVFLTQLAGR